ETQDAIRKFQSANNLPVTGNLDDGTQKALGMTVKGKTKGKTNPGAYQNRGMNNPPAGTDPAAMGPSAQPQDSDTSAHRQYDKSDKAADAKTVREYERRAEKAGEVLESLTGAGDSSIPDSLLRRAEGIAVIPGMVKEAFGIGGRYGKGLLSA